MADRLEELESAVRELSGQLHRLDDRVRALERPAPIDRPAGEPPALAAIALPSGTIALVGRTLLVLAGAYLARALTDGRIVPAGASVAIGLAYAAFWQAQAAREANAGRRASATFHALASGLIAFPLIGETTARFGLLGPRAACAALVAFFALGMGVAWRHRLMVAAVVVTGLGLSTAVALLVTTHDLAAAFLALLAVAAGLEWLAYRERWLALRWPAAAVADVVALLLAMLVSRTQGLPDTYVPISAPAAALALLGLPAVYLVSLAARTLRHAQPVTIFEATQGALAVLLGLGGALRILAARGGSVAGLGALALALGALGYAAAFSFAERRAGQGRNFYFYSTAGGLLTLGGAKILFGPALPLALAGLGLAAALFGRRFGRMTLRVHSALYLVAGAFTAGLVLPCARALAGENNVPLEPIAWLAAFTAAAVWAVLATDPGAPRSGAARTPQLLVAMLVVFALGKALLMGLWAGLGERVVSDPGAAAVLRTAVLAALAFGLALAARRLTWPELRWLVYPVVALGGVKLLVQDLRTGRPATLVLSLALYGAVLVLAPRLLSKKPLPVPQ